MLTPSLSLEYLRSVSSDEITIIKSGDKNTGLTACNRILEEERVPQAQLSKLLDPRGFILKTGIKLNVKWPYTCS